MELKRPIILVKGEHRYIFRYKAGQERELVRCFAEMAADPERNFDWFDAAVLSYQIRRRLDSELREI